MGGRVRVVNVVGRLMDGKPGMLMLKGGRPPLPPPGNGVLVAVGVTVGFPLPGTVNEPPGGV